MDLAAVLDAPELTSDLARVEASLKDAVSTDDPFLTDVATHLIGAGGKRLRPALVLSAAYAAHGRGRAASADTITGAVAVELVHLGSLYHDDVIDEAVTRRGVPSVNARWSNVVAILAGDFLLARASELAAGLGTEVAGLLASTIGELCKGQVLELRHAFNVDRDEEAYFGAIAGKTGALMATSCRIGGLVSGLDRPVVDGLTAFGRELGLLYQLVDDILDLTATEAELGKPAGLDLVEGVYTLPVIYAVRESPDLRSMLGATVGNGQVDRARELVASAGGVERTRLVAVQRAEAAAHELASLPGLDTEIVAGLTRLATDLVDRTS